MEVKANEPTTERHTESSCIVQGMTEYKNSPYLAERCPGTYLKLLCRPTTVLNLQIYACSSPVKTK